MAADGRNATAHVQLVDGYRFTASFPDVPDADAITIDESSPLGTGAGPTPTGLLAAAIGGCLSASLTLCLNKAHLDPDAVNAHVTAHVGRNEAGRLRIQSMDVELTPCFVGELEVALVQVAHRGNERHTLPTAPRLGECAAECSDPIYDPHARSYGRHRDSGRRGRRHRTDARRTARRRQGSRSA